MFRAGYELFYTPLPEAAKRAAKSTVDVSVDCLGKGVGAALIVLLTRLDPLYTFVTVNAAGGAGSRSRVCGRAPLEGAVCERARGRASSSRRGSADSGKVLAGRLHDGAKHGRPG